MAVFKRTEQGEKILPLVSLREFVAFVIVQNDGETNMLHFSAVHELSEGEVTEDGHIYIINNYEDLSKYYGVGMDNIEEYY